MIMNVKANFFKPVFACLTFYFFYVAGLIFPDIFWGTHFIAFIPLWLKVLFLIIPLVSFFGQFSTDNPTFEGYNEDKRKSSRYIVSFITAIILSALFFNLDIQTDIYGDARDLIRNESSMEKVSRMSPTFERISVIANWNLSLCEKVPLRLLRSIWLTTKRTKTEQSRRNHLGYRGRWQRLPGPLLLEALV